MKLWGLMTYDRIFYFETSKFHHNFGQNKLVFRQNEIKVLDGILMVKWKLQMTLKVQI